MTSLRDAIGAHATLDPQQIPVEQARQIIRSFVQPIAESERVALRSALDRILAADLVSPIDVPSHDNSAMDGWAVRHCDLRSDGEATLTEIGTAYAGNEFPGDVGPGQCVRIMTGAPMPCGTDTVVIQELVRTEGVSITFPGGQREGQNLRRAGEDVARGKPALRAGTLLRPAEIGLIASLGISEIAVRRRLRVAFFSTGDELRALTDHTRAEHSSPGRGMVYDSNRHTVWAMLTRLGCEALDLGVVRDDPGAIEAAFRDAAERADAIVTTGGMSVGEADFTRSIMNKLGEIEFWNLAIRPGRPMAFGRIRSEGKSAYVFGLPGNPVAVMVTFYHVVRGAELPLLRVKCRSALRKSPGRTEFQRGRLDLVEGEWTVGSTGEQGSGMLHSMTEANCFIVLHHDRDGVRPGDFVDVTLMEGIV